MEYKSLKTSIRCIVCLKIVYLKPSRIKKGAKFCSRDCHNEFRRKEIKVTCKICNKKFMTNPCKIKNGWSKYCSQKCYYKSRIKKVIKICPVCKKIFYTIPSEINNGRGINCSKPCQSKANIGKKISEETKEKLRIANIGRQHSEKSKEKQRKVALKKGFGKWMKGRIPPFIIQGKHNHPTGEKHNNWKGGVTPLYCLIRDTDEYKKWRNDVFHKDNYICKGCFQEGGDLEVHHKKQFSIILKEFLKQYSQFSPIDDKETLVRLSTTYEPLWDIDNGKTLCKKCHRKTFYKKVAGEFL